MVRPCVARGFVVAEFGSCTNVSGLDVELPVRTHAAWLAAAAADIRMIELLSPRRLIESQRIAVLLQRHVPADEHLTFCPGDLVCSQLLSDRERWSITDFDLCHIGDAYRELAMLIASLPQGVRHD